MTDPSNAGDLFRYAADALESMRNAVSKGQCLSMRGVFENAPQVDAADATPELPADPGYATGDYSDYGN